MEPLPAVDGSLLEGGGQVLRVALACGALLGRPLHIHSIRGGRSRPGLGHQHSTGAKLVADICGGVLWPDAVQYGGHCAGVSDLRLWPGVRGLLGGEFVADTHTAGAVTLLLQAALPCALLAGHSSHIRMVLRGGTNTSFSPPVDFLSRVLFPTLCARFGVPDECLSLDLVRRGFYPRGGGELRVTIKPLPAARCLRACTLLERGDVVSVHGIVYGGGTGRSARKAAASAAAARLRRHFGAGVDVDVAADRDGGVDPQAAAAAAAEAAAAAPSSRDSKHGGDTARALPNMRQRRAIADARAARLEGVCGCLLVLTTTTGCLIPGDSLLEQAGARAGSGHVNPSEVAEKAVDRLVEAWEAGGTVCEHTMDQLIVFMALARGTSKVLCPGRTSISSMHLPTAVHFCSLLTGAKFTLTEVPHLTPEGKEPCILVECVSVGYTGAPAGVEPSVVS